MNSLDILHFSLSLGFIILVGFLAYVLYYLGQALKSLNHVLENTEDITRDVNMLKNGVKLGILNILNIFLKKRR